jgi:hypothetical protein
MTKEEFEQRYADMHFITLEELHARGEHAIPCSCGMDGCLGWVMADFIYDNLEGFAA